MGVFQRVSHRKNVVGGLFPLLALVAVPFAVRGEVLYSNDFSVRTSADPVPRAGWFVKNYTWPSALSYGYGEQNYTPLSPYSEPSRVQDGWAKIVGTNVGKQNVNFWVRSNEDSSNPMGVFSNQSGKYGSEEQIRRADDARGEAAGQGRQPRGARQLDAPRQVRWRLDRA